MYTFLLSAQKCVKEDHVDNCPVCEFAQVDTD